ncbi:MAG: hypothetical protein B7Z37_18200 [Verrucomicrobia bacterium 12-59-8]|nr:MAG: hypothetical protein B7Z37_18200 [Verrucomicrobia bacterium 12-59-8]
MKDFLADSRFFVFNRRVDLAACCTLLLSSVSVCSQEVSANAVAPTVELQKLLVHVHEQASAIPSLAMEWVQRDEANQECRVEFCQQNGKYYYKSFKKGEPSGSGLEMMSAFDGVTYWHWDIFSNTLAISSTLSDTYTKLRFENKLRYNPLYLSLYLLQAKKHDPFVMPDLGNSATLVGAVLPFFRGQSSTPSGLNLRFERSDSLVRSVLIEADTLQIVGAESTRNGKVLAKHELSDWYELKAGGKIFKIPLKYQVVAPGMDPSHYPMYQVNRDSIKLLKQVIPDEAFRVPTTYASEIRDMDLHPLLKSK